MTDPSIGVWLSDDGTVGKPDPTNMYRYVGNNPTNRVDPSGLAAADPDAKFRKDAQDNGVPDDVIEIIISTANGVDVPKPWPLGEHNYCEQWVDAFERQLSRNLNKKGYKDGIKAACQGGVKGPLDKTVFYIEFLIDKPQHHTALKLTFKDGSVWYIDCSTLSTQDANNLTGGKTHFTPQKGVPKDWETVPSPKEKFMEEVNRRCSQADGATIGGHVNHPWP
jgi:hypothetical protein